MKDAKGHGSNGKGSLSRGQNGAVTPPSRGPAPWYDTPLNEPHPVAAANAAAARTSYSGDLSGNRNSGLVSNAAAANELSSGTPKSAPAPIHDGMGGASRVGSSYNEHGSRHGYNPDSVNDAIAAQNRSGRGKIGGREASAIHRLLKGR